MPAGLRAVQRRHRRGGIPGFPGGLANLAGWYDASTVTGKNDGDVLSVVSDVGISAHHLGTVGAGGGPNYKTAIQNGLPVFRFNGTSQRITGTFTLNQPFTLWIVWQLRGSVVIQKDICDGATAASTIFGTITVNAKHQMYAGTAGVGTDGISADTWYVSSVLFNGASSKISLDNGTDVTGNPGAANAGGWSMGGRSSDAFFAPVDIGELFLSSAAESDGTRQTGVRYLGAKWGVTVA